MRELLRKFLTGETLRYLVFGVLTVLVNIAAYRLLAVFSEKLAANTAAFFLAVMFAYWTNSRFVFGVPCTGKRFVQFMGMRIGTLVIDNGGMWLLLGHGWNDLLAKCVVNAVIIAVNYLCSKLLIFTERRKTE